MLVHAARVAEGRERRFAGGKDRENALEMESFDHWRDDSVQHGEGLSRMSLVRRSGMQGLSPLELPFLQIGDVCARGEGDEHERGSKGMGTRACAPRSPRLLCVNDANRKALLTH